MTALNPGFDRHRLIARRRGEEKKEEKGRENGPQLKGHYLSKGSDFLFCKGEQEEKGEERGRKKEGRRGKGISKTLTGHTFRQDHHFVRRA